MIKLDSSSPDGLIEPFFKIFSAKIAEYDARKVTGNKCNANFVFKPGVTSQYEEIHDMKPISSELCKIQNLKKMSLNRHIRRKHVRLEEECYYHN